MELELRAEHYAAKILRVEAEERQRLANTVLDSKDRWRIIIVVNKVMYKQLLNSNDMKIWSTVAVRFGGSSLEEIVQRIHSAISAPTFDNASIFSAYGEKRHTIDRKYHKP